METGIHRMRTVAILLFAVLLGAATAAEVTSPAPGADTAVLDTSSFWRCFMVRGTELVRLESGGLESLSELAPAGRVKADDSRLFSEDLHKLCIVFEPFGDHLEGIRHPTRIFLDPRINPRFFAATNNEDFDA